MLRQACYSPLFGLCNRDRGVTKHRAIAHPFEEMRCHDADKMNVIDPSCNTDQGVQVPRECLSGKLKRVMKVKRFLET